MTDFDEIARALVKQIPIRQHDFVNNDFDAKEKIAAALREAVEDERERCAKITEAESGPGFSCRHVDHAQGFCECSAKAAAIRAPINT